jgi:hypothetical protein
MGGGVHVSSDGFQILVMVVCWTQTQGRNEKDLAPLERNDCEEMNPKKASRNQA